MPALKYKPPKYALHKSSGQALIKWRGKSIYLGPYGSDESRARYAELISNMPKLDEAAKPVPRAGEILVGQVVLKYFEHAQRYYVRDGVPTGEHKTIRSCLRYLTRRFAELPVSEFGPRKLKQVMEDMIELKQSRRYINKAAGIVKRCFKWAASEELVPADIAVALSTVAGLQKGRSAAREKPPIGPVPDEAVEATLPFLSDLAVDVISLMRLTGARPGEILALSATQIDRSNPECWRCELPEHKTSHHGKRRALLVGPRGQEILKRRILKAGRGPLFPMNRTTLRELVHRACRKAGIPNWHPNQIRHAFGTDVRANHGLEAAQVLLGHTRADVTQIYAERDERLAVEVARKIG
jgi:integrase